MRPVGSKELNRLGSNESTESFTTHALVRRFSAHMKPEQISRREKFIERFRQISQSVSAFMIVANGVVIGAETNFEVSSSLVMTEDAKNSTSRVYFSLEVPEETLRTSRGGSLCQTDSGYTLYCNQPRCVPTWHRTYFEALDNGSRITSS